MQTISKTQGVEQGANLALLINMTEKKPIDTRFLRSGFNVVGGICDPAVWNGAECNHYLGHLAANSEATDPQDGDVYYNTTEHTFRKCVKSGNTISWVDQAPKFFIYPGMPTCDRTTGTVYRWGTAEPTCANIENPSNWRQEGGSLVTTFLGTYAEAPSADGHTNPYYFNSTDHKFYMWDGTSWGNDITMPFIGTVQVADEAGVAGTLKHTVYVNGIPVKGNADSDQFLTDLIDCYTNPATSDDPSNYEVDLSSAGIIVGSGTVIKVRFHYGHLVTSGTPTLQTSVGNPKVTIQGEDFCWSAGDIIELLYNGEIWVALNKEAGQKAKLDNFSNLDFTLFDFDNADQVNQKPDPATIKDEFPPVGVTLEQFEEMFARLSYLFNNPDGKFHFLKFKGRRCKFDIEAMVNGTIYFSFIYRAVSGIGSGKETPIASHVYVSMTRSVGDYEEVSYSFKYTTTNLVGGGGADPELAGKYTALEAKYRKLDEITNWYQLVEESE